MRIYLIGLPGVGKSTVGKELANRLEYQFIDLDLYIEKSKKSFDEFFLLHNQIIIRIKFGMYIMYMKEKRSCCLLFLKNIFC